MVTLPAKGILLDADDEMELEVGRESALKFLAVTLAKTQEEGGTELRFDRTSPDGCLLFKDERGWTEMVPLPAEALAPYHRFLANELFGASRGLLVKLVGGWSGYEPTTVCQLEGDDAVHDWEARLKPTAIWFRRIPTTSQLATN